MEVGWAQVLTIIGANLILFLGLIATIISLFIHSNKRIDDAMKAINEEMKDFHGRLCAIEERRTKILER
jgi:hypothetical protein